MKGGKIFSFMLLAIMVCLLVTDVDAKKRNKGRVNFAQAPPNKNKIYTHPEWMDNFAFFCDAIFDWMGYHEIPHTMRYSFILLLLVMPCWAMFFIYCCVHNDEYEDPVEEA